MPAIHLIEGPVGAGKSTYAGRLALEINAPHLNLDEWMVNLFRPDRPEEDFLAWYADRKDRCLQQIWLVATEVLNAGSDVILELGLVQRAARDTFYRQVDGTDYALNIYWLDVDQDTRLQRVHKRNAEQSGTFRMEVSDEVFALASAAWESPDEIELRERSIRVI